MSNRTASTVLPNGRLPESYTIAPDDPDALRERIGELEALCAEVYDAAVELGLPQALLNRLWTVAARGCSPHAFDLDMPPRPASLPAEPLDDFHPAARSTARIRQTEPMPLPDIRLTDRAASDKHQASQSTRATVLADLPERRSVMVVDDDPIMLDVLARILGRENYELLTATSGRDALSQVALRTAPIDLLVTDYAMPEMQGRELADALRARYADIRVLYQTGFSDMLFENRAELEEGSAFLEKPFTARGLREAVRFRLFGMLNPSAPAAQ